MSLDDGHMSLDDITSYEEAIEVIEDLIGILQELHHKMTLVEDFNDYRVAETLIEFIEDSLLRYDSL